MYKRINQGKMVVLLGKSLQILWGYDMICISNNILIILQTPISFHDSAKKNVSKKKKKRVLKQLSLSLPFTTYQYPKNLNNKNSQGVCFKKDPL